MSIASIALRRLPARVARPVAAAALALVGGCSALQTRPGHPDSYGVGVFGGNYYATHGRALEWPTAGQADKATLADRQSNGVPVHDLPPDYKATTVPREIWTARGAAWNLSLRYLAASYKAGEVQDLTAVPMFGAAVATVALGIARASTPAIAATGLGGGAAYAGYTYLHPDKDLTTDQMAAFDLRCVVDASLPLRTMSVVPLLLDKAALQDALDQLAAASGALMVVASPSTTQQAQQKAVTAAQDAAKQTLANLDTNIKLYNEMPRLIYVAVDQIDRAAQTGGARTIDYNAILSGLRSISANQDAGASAQGAARTAMNTSPPSMLAPPAGAKFDTNLRSLTTDAGGSLTALASGEAGTTTDPGSSGTNQAIATRLDGTLKDSSNAQQTVTRIAADANEDLAIVEYQAIATNIQACPSGQQVVPVTAPSATNPPQATGTGAKAGS